MTPDAQTHLIPMRDGVRLACDIYGAPPETTETAETAATARTGAPPEAAAPPAPPRPVLLERTPYGRRATRASDQAALGQPTPTPEDQARIFVADGFIYVRQDCRGRGDSEGTFTKYHDEASDGFDAVAWLREQPWCDGRVFMTGVSYSAHAQTAAAGVGTPLAGMILDSGGLWHPFETGIRVGGAYELKQATWAMRHALKSVHRRSEAQRRELEAVDIAEWFARMPWRRGDSPLTAAPEYESYLFELWGRQIFDATWRTPDLWAEGHIEAFPRVPAVVMGSWYDPYVRSSLKLFAALHDRNPASRLIMGPWTHGSRVTTHSGDVEFGPQAAFDRAFGADAVSWRSAWLAALAQPPVTPETSQPPASPEPPQPPATPEPAPVHYFEMGGGSGTRTPEGRLDHGGTWRSAASWPPEASAPLTLHLGIAPDRTGTLLSEPQPATEVLLAADAARPVATRGGQVTSGEPVMRGGAFDQGAPEALGAKNRVLSFRTEPLAAPLTIAGPLTVTVTLTSTARDADLAVKLIDEYPPSEAWPAGFAMNLSDSILRASYREGFARRVPLTPGEPFTLTVEAPDVANRFEAGHRLRLDLAASNFPRFDVNPGTCGDPWDAPVPSTLTVRLGDARATLTVSQVPSD